MFPDHRNNNMRPADHVPYQVDGDRQQIGASVARYLSDPPDGENNLILPSPGTTLGERFAIIRRLNQGRQGVVLLARDQHRSQDVALKFALSTGSGNDAAAQHLKLELAASGRILDHRHIIRVNDIHSAKWNGRDLVYLSMEYAEGASLHEWLRANGSGDHALSQAIEYFVQACEGIRSFHDVGLCYGDVHLDNVMLAGGIIKIIDFGHATEHNAARGETPSTIADVESLIRILELIVKHTVGIPVDTGGPAEHCSSARIPCRLPSCNLVGITRVIDQCLHSGSPVRYATVNELLQDITVLSQSTPTGPVIEKNRIDNVWQAACHAMQNNKVHEAMHLCDRVLQISPEYMPARSMLDYLRERQQQADQLYHAVATGMDRDGLSELIEMTREACRIFPNHSLSAQILTRLSSRVRRYRQLVEKGNKACSHGNQRVALQCLRLAFALNPDATELVPVMAELAGE